MWLKQTIAMTEKELLLSLRYKIPFFLNIFANPIVFSIIYLVVYNYFFSNGSLNAGDLNSNNFIPFILLGSIVYLQLNSATTAFNAVFVREKYWQTAFALVFVTKNDIVFILSGLLTTIIRSIAPTILFFAITYFFYPAGWFAFFVSAIVLVASTMIFLSFGLVVGCFSLSDENIVPFFDYFKYGWIFLSCFYYPIEALPKAIHPLILANPAYQAVFLMRESWINGTVSIVPMAYLILLAITMPYVAIYIFGKVFKKYGIQGY